ncbi:MAG: pilus assembly protein [Alphaproteobacteria bacterium]|nr:pilus assembly protein [Alphaproteobacteria bacterium]
MVIGRFTTKREARGLLRDRAGNVAMMWALMGTVLIGLVGITVDFTRAQSIRNAMQNAADGAALVAERSSNLSIGARTAAARAFFDAEVGDMVSNVTFNVVELSDGGHRVTASMPMPMSLARIISDDAWTLAVAAEAQANASPPIEVALVLDNTGSMANDMQGLRDAASDLADDLLGLDGDTVRVALVPFVAQVNIGNEQSHRAWLDQTGAAPYNGELLEDRSIAYRNLTLTGSTPTGANCQNLSTTPNGYTGPYRITWRPGTGGSGGLVTRCYAWTPADGVSHLALFDLISNEDWKGCVEARPEPYDITDAAPNTANADTMFVPFFWLDTVDGVTGTSNSYFTDSVGNISGATMSTSMGLTSSTQQAREAAMFNVFKYRNNAASLDTSAPDTRGPNRGCPTPIVPLTSDEGVVQTNIAAMRHWSGGGTNQAEGLAWGWRVLSPGAPFTEGEPFNSARDNVRKVIVLMSDGENTNVGSDVVMSSDYSAYNHLGLWRDYASGGLLNQLIGGILRGILPPQYRRNINSSSSYVTYVNNREAALCTNIKNAGIEIYTVIFRETDQATENLMRNCATSTSHFYRANNAAELARAFDAIGTGIGALRLTR